MKDRRYSLWVLGLVWLCWSWNAFGSMALAQELVPSVFIRETRAKARPNQKLIVFVHGLGGDARETWTAENGTYWPRLVAQDHALKEFDIFVVSYPTSLFRAGQTIPELGVFLNQLLKSQRILGQPRPTYRQLFFVAHSLGNFVVYSALLDPGAYRGVTPSLLVSLGAPFTGAKLATWGRIISPNRQIPNLSEMDAWLTEFNLHWRNRLPLGLEIACAYGTQDELVDKSSSTYVMTRAPAQAIEADHTTLVKPTSPKAKVHLWLRQQLLQMPQEKELVARWKSRLAELSLWNQQNLSPAAREEIVRALQAALTTVQLTAQAPEDSPSLYQQALRYLKAGKPDSAQKLLEKFLEETQGSQPTTHAKIEIAQASQQLAGLLPEAHPRRLKLYREVTQLDPTNPEGWNQLGQSLMKLGPLSEAEVAFQKILTLSPPASPLWQAIAWGNLGRVYQEGQDWERAEKSYRQALQLSEAFGDQERMAIQYGNLGVLYKLQGNLEQAEASYRQALTLNQALGNREGEAINSNNLANLFWLREDLTQAKTFYQKALMLFEQLGLSSEAEQVRQNLQQ